MNLFMENKQNGGFMKKVIRNILIIVFISSLILFIDYYMNLQRSRKAYDEAQKIYYETTQNISEQEKTTKDKVKEDEEKSIEEKPEKPEQIPEEKTGTKTEIPQENNLEKIMAKSGEVAGWLKIANTRIDYPVVQTDNNDYYINHDYLGNRNIYGAIFMDFRNKDYENDDNIIIYGHKMRDGSMFSDLTIYVQGNSAADNFYNNNIIQLSVEGKEYKYRIFSVYVVNLDKEKYHLYANVYNEQLNKEYLDDIVSRSIFSNPEIQIDTDDKIISLVTCSFWFENSRVIVHGKRIQ